MPRGFLVKRTKNSSAYSYRRNSEEERSDSGSEQENVYTHFGSPDSGFSQSPINLTFKDAGMGMTRLESHSPMLVDSPVGINANNYDNHHHQHHHGNYHSANHLHHLHHGSEEGNHNNNNQHVLGGPYSDRASVTSVSSTRSNSPLSVGTPPYGSPFYFSAFDRLSVSSPSGKSRGTTVAPVVASSPASSPAPVLAPASPSKKRGSPEADGAPVRTKTPKKPKAARKIHFDEDKTSPVSGTIIRDISDSEDEGVRVVCGDIDSALNLVEVTPEARAELDKIENRIGDYVCMLCKEHYEDAFHLAQHKCSRIVHVEYRCPECDKVFNCPANLASHRRWHKPRPNASGNSNAASAKQTNIGNGAPSRILPKDGSENVRPSVDGVRTPSPAVGETEGVLYDCEQCGKKFKRQSYLRKHLASHNEERPFPCQFCGKVLRSEAARAKHVLQHAVGHAGKDGAAAAACPVCAASFPNKAAMERHQRLHTSEVFTCKYCSATFYSSPGLTRHINKCHPTENRQVILLQMPVSRPC